MFQLPAMLRTGGNDIKACRVNAAVSENIRQLGNIFFDAIEYSCKEMAQIVGKHFLWIDICLGAYWTSSKQSGRM